MFFELLLQELVVSVHELVEVFESFSHVGKLDWRELLKPSLELLHSFSKEVLKESFVSELVDILILVKQS